MEKVNDITYLFNLEDIDIFLYNNIIIFKLRYKDNKYISGYDFNNLKKKYDFFNNCMSSKQIMDKLVHLKNNQDSLKIYENDDNIQLKIENMNYKLNKFEIFDIILKKYVDKSFIEPELIGMYLKNGTDLIKEKINNLDNLMNSYNPRKTIQLYEKKFQQIEKLNSKISKIEKKIFNIYENKTYSNFKTIYSFQPYNDNETIKSIDIFPNGNYITNSIIGHIKIWNEKNELIQEIHNKDSEKGRIIIKNNNFFIQIGLGFENYIRNKKTNKWELQTIKYIFLNKNEKTDFKIRNLYLKNIVFCKNKIICYFKNDLPLIQIYEILFNYSYQLINTIILPFEKNESIGGIEFINESLTLIIATSKSVYLLNFITFEIKKKYINSVRCYIDNGICKLDENRIIFHNGNKNVLKILNLTNDEFIEIKISSICWSLFLFKEKELFLCGLNNGKLNVFKTYDYTLYCIIDLKLNYINGFLQLVKQKDIFICYSDLYLNFIKYNKKEIHEYY